MEIPYIDNPPKKKTTREVPFTYIESTNILSKKIGLIKFKQLDFPKGSYLISAEGEVAVYTPSGETIPVIPTGQLIAANGLIYDKTENIYWVNS